MPLKDLLTECMDNINNADNPQAAISALTDAKTFLKSCKLHEHEVGIFSAFLDVLLNVFLPNWYDCLSLEKQKSLFDPLFFGSDLVSGKEIFMKLCYNLQYTKETAKLKKILNLLNSIVSNEIFVQLIQFYRSPNGKRIHSSRFSRSDAFFSTVVSLPDRVTNAIGQRQDVYKNLESQVYFNRLLNCILPLPGSQEAQQAQAQPRVFCRHDNTAVASNETFFYNASQLVDLMCMRGQTELFLDHLLSYLFFSSISTSTSTPPTTTTQLNTSLPFSEVFFSNLTLTSVTSLLSELVNSLSSQTLDKFVDALLKRCKTYFDEKKNGESLILDDERSAIKSLDDEELLFILCVLFQKKLKNNEYLGFLLYEKSIFSRVYHPSCAVALIRYLSFCETEKEGKLLKLLTKLMEIWGSLSFLNDSTKQQRMFMCSSLVSCYSVLPLKLLQDNSDLVSLMSFSAENWMKCGSMEEHRLGLVVIEICANYLNSKTYQGSEDVSPLAFEYEETSEIAALKRSSERYEGLLEKDFLCETSIQKMKLKMNKKIKSKATSPTGTGFSTTMDDLPANKSKEKSNKGFDPDAVFFDSESDSDANDDGEDDDESSSDDDLIPYHIPEEEDVSDGEVESKPVIHLRECVNCLQAYDDPRRITQGLKCVESLVLGHYPHRLLALKEVCIELTNILLHLQDEFALDGFNEMRMKGMTALCYTCPELVSDFLTQQFYAPNYSLRQRLDVLQVLANSSSDIAKNQLHLKEGANFDDVDDDVDGDDIRSTAKCLVNTFHLGESSATDVLVQSRIQNNTRRFVSSKNKTLKKTSANRFGLCCDHFFYGLLHPYNLDKTTNVSILMGEGELLALFLHALSTIVTSSAQTARSTQRAKVVLDFLHSVKYHPNINVTRAILFCLFCTLTSVSEAGFNEILLKLDELSNWLEDVVKEGSDTQCQELALSTLALIENKVKDMQVSSAAFVPPPITMKAPDYVPSGFESIRYK